MVISCLERSNRLKYRHLSLLTQLHLPPQSPLVLDSMVWIWSRKESKATTAFPGLKLIFVQLLGRVGDVQKRAVDENASEPPLRKGSIICSQNLYLSLTCGMGRSKSGLGFLSHQIPYDSKPLVIHLYTKNVTKPSLRFQNSVCDSRNQKIPCFSFSRPSGAPSHEKSHLFSLFYSSR